MRNTVSHFVILYLQYSFEVIFQTPTLTELYRSRHDNQTNLCVERGGCDVAGCCSGGVECGRTEVRWAGDACGLGRSSGMVMALSGLLLATGAGRLGFLGCPIFGL